MVVNCILLNKVFIYKHVKEQYSKERENFEWVQRWSFWKQHILKDHSAFIFTVKQSINSQYLFTSQHGVATQKI